MSFVHLFGSQEKDVVSWLHFGQVEQGICGSLGILIIGLFSF